MNLLAGVAAFFRGPRVETPTHGPAARIMVEIAIEVESIACGYDDDDSVTLRVHMGPKAPEVTMREGERVSLRLVGYDFSATPDA